MPQVVQHLPNKHKAKFKPQYSQKKSKKKVVCIIYELSSQERKNTRNRNWNHENTQRMTALRLQAPRSLQLSPCWNLTSLPLYISTQVKRKYGAIHSIRTVPSILWDVYKCWLIKMSDEILQIHYLKQDSILKGPFPTCPPKTKYK
jgi:hypothetical protein